MGDAKPPNPEIVEELKELAEAGASTITERAEQTKLTEERRGAFTRRQLKRRIARIAKDIEALEAHILKHLDSNEGLRRISGSCSIPSFGKVTAMTLPARSPRNKSEGRESDLALRER